MKSYGENNNSNNQNNLNEFICNFKCRYKYIFSKGILQKTKIA